MLTTDSGIIYESNFKQMSCTVRIGWLCTLHRETLYFVYVCVLTILLDIYVPVLAFNANSCELRNTEPNSDDRLTSII